MTKRKTPATPTPTKTEAKPVELPKTRKTLKPLPLETKAPPSAVSPKKQLNALPLETKDLGQVIKEANQKTLDPRAPTVDPKTKRVRKPKVDANKPITPPITPATPEQAAKFAPPPLVGGVTDKKLDALGFPNPNQMPNLITNEEFRAELEIHAPTPTPEELAKKGLSTSDNDLHAYWADQLKRERLKSTIILVLGVSFALWAGIFILSKALVHP